MPAGSTLGLKAKLGVETDERQVQRETNNLKDKIKEAAEAEMEADVGALKEDIVTAIEDASQDAKWAPDIDTDPTTGASHDSISQRMLGNRMEALGKEMPNIDDANSSIHGPGPSRGSGADRDGGLLGEAFSGMKGAGGKFLKVGLAGAVGAGILSKLSGLADSSPRMMKVLEQMQRSISLFARPFFDYAALWLEGEAQALLEYAANFNKWYNEGNLPVAMVKTAEDVATKGGDASTGETIGRIGGFLAGGAGGAYLGATKGAAVGGAAGSVVPGIGTGVGAAGGALIGGTAGALGGMKTGGFLGDKAGDLVDWLKDKWPGWSDFFTMDTTEWMDHLGIGWPGWPDFDWPGWVGGVIPEFDLEWKGDILPDFPGWIKNSPGVIDAFPGWGNWIDPLEWNPPSSSVMREEIEDKIPELDWNIPSWSDMRGWVREKIPSLDWNIPTFGDMRGWIQEKIPELDWNIPSVSSVLSKINSKIPTLNWPNISRDDIIDAVNPGVDPLSSDSSNDSEFEHTDGSDSDADYTHEDLKYGGRREMATGGLVTRPTEAVVGEAGPEVVAPFNEFMNAVNSPERRFGGSAGGSASGARAGGGEAVDEIVGALDELKREIKKISDSGDVYLDGRKVGEVSRDSDQRYRQSRVVTR